MVNFSGMLIGAICGGGFILIFAGLGVFLIYSAIKGRQKAGESQQWPSTAGQIAEARVTRSMHTDSDGDTSYSYAPHVRYTYQVGGQEFTGDKITFGFTKTHSSESKAQQALSRFPLGGQVSVYYNPASPEEAVLERTAGGSTVGMVIGIVFLLVSICVGCPLVGGLLYNVLSTQ
ncbi:MAG: DUF3592 domain-containing protein [Anaerolineales bacterium]|nr:DUF3592 domain-containing protein [Anaerolineales bacterium]